MEFITRLTQLVPIERIYLNHFDHNGSRQQELTILLPITTKLHITEARPLIEMAMDAHKEYRFRIFYIQDAKRALHYGSMVFYTICREENLIYKAANDSKLLSTNITAKAVLKKAKRSFEKEWKKVLNFREGFHFYFKQENYPFAAFMLHQVIELSYRNVEQLVIGREKTSHSIRNHQKVMEQYDRELANIFNEEDKREKRLLTLLDESYRAVRYDQDYAIHPDQLLCILTKADQIEKVIFALYESLVEQFVADMKVADETQEIKEVQDAEQVSATEPIFKGEAPLDQITARICDLIPVTRIYKVARYKKVDVRSGMFPSVKNKPIEEHYCLLVICNAPCTPEIFNVQGVINQDETIAATVTLLIHSVEEVQDALRDDLIFFNELLHNGELIYARECDDFEIPEMDAGQLLLRKGQLWYNRYNRAVALMEAAANVTEEENGIVMASMLSHAMVQLCLVYIEESISYRPNQLNLKHLFAVCRMINPLIDEVFPTSREEDRKLFAVLLDADRSLRYRILACVDTTDQCVLLRRCNAWMEKVKELRISE